MYEWDEAKRRENVRKHGVAFAIVEDFDWLNSIASEDESARGERRYISIGPIGPKIYVLVWTERPDDVIRIDQFARGEQAGKKMS